MELLTKSRVCQGPGVTEKAKVPVRGGDTPRTYLSLIGTWLFFLREGCTKFRLYR